MLDVRCLNQHNSKAHPEVETRFRHHRSFIIAAWHLANLHKPGKRIDRRTEPGRAEIQLKPNLNSNFKSQKLSVTFRPTAEAAAVAAARKLWSESVSLQLNLGQKIRLRLPYTRTFGKHTQL